MEETAGWGHSAVISGKINPHREIGFKHLTPEHDKHLSIHSQSYQHGLLPVLRSISAINHCNHCIWLFPQDCPESPTHVDHPAEVHFSNILHHPTPVLSAGAHSRLSVATPISFSPFRSFTPTSAIKAHVQSPAPIRLLSPALNQISLNRTMSPAIGRWPVFLIACQMFVHLKGISTFYLFWFNGPLNTWTKTFLSMFAC